MWPQTKHLVNFLEATTEFGESVRGHVSIIIAN